jgi:hypothetical protein
MYAKPEEDTESTNILAALMRTLERPHVITERGREIFIWQQLRAYSLAGKGIRHEARRRWQVTEVLVLTGQKFSC